jgi:hypothetical protein
MRARKPWVRALWILEGWYVLFMGFTQFGNNSCEHARPGCALRDHAAPTPSVGMGSARAFNETELRLLPDHGDLDVKNESEILPTYEDTLRAPPQFSQKITAPRAHPGVFTACDSQKKPRQHPFEDVAAIDLATSVLTYIETHQAGCAAEVFDVYRPSKFNRSSSE